MELLQEYGLFLAKAVTVVMAIGVIIGLVAMAGQAKRASKQGFIQVRKYNDDITNMIIRIVIILVSSLSGVPSRT